MLGFGLGLGLGLGSMPVEVSLGKGTEVGYLSYNRHGTLLGLGLC